MALSSSSLFEFVIINWQDLFDGPSTVRYRTTDGDEGAVIVIAPTQWAEDFAADSPLEILRGIYASSDGFLDADSNPLIVGFYSLPAGFGITLPEHIHRSGFPNPLDADECASWLGVEKWRGALIAETSYSTDPDTGRPSLESSIDDIPVKRVPSGGTYDYALDNWTAMVAGGNIVFRTAWTEEDELTTTQEVSDHPDMVAFLGWLELLRVDGTGDPVGDYSDGVTSAIGGFRDYRFEQGSGLDDVDVQIESYFQGTVNGFIRNLSFTFEKISGETGTFNIEAIREILDTKVPIAVSSSDAIEPPERGSTAVAQRVLKLVFPENRELFLRRDRLILNHPTLGHIPLDGASVRSVKFADLDTQSGSIKWMPNDGAHVIHFGHNETADGTIRFRDLPDQVQNDGVDEPYRIHNVSSDYNVTIQDMDADTLIILHPGEQCGFQIGLERDGSGGEINAINPPARRLIYGRGQAMPNLDGAHNYLHTDGSNYRTLLWPSAAVNFINSEAFENGEADDDDALTISTVSPALWGIKGSFQITQPGIVDIDLLYRAQINVPDGESALGSLSIGNGASIWISEGGTSIPIRVRFFGLLELGGDGASQDYNLIYRGLHTTNTRFIFLHRVPASSTIEGTDSMGNAYDNWNHVDQTFLSCDVSLEPTIRKVVS